MVCRWPIWSLLIYISLIESAYIPIPSGHIAQCELIVMRYGSDMADTLNAPIGRQNWNQRTIQDAIVEKIGFAPWVANGVHGSNGVTLSGGNARAIHTNSGWIGKNVRYIIYVVY
jgi:hypothetical protein